MHLNILYQNNRISLKAIRICISAKLNTTADVTKFFHTHGDFLRLPKCGVKTSNELMQIAVNREYSAALQNGHSLSGESAFDPKFLRSEKKSPLLQKPANLSNDEWMHFYNRLELFGALNGTLPNKKAQAPDEALLGHWWDAQNRMIHSLRKRRNLILKLRHQYPG